MKLNVEDSSLTGCWYVNFIAAVGPYDAARQTSAYFSTNSYI